MEPAKNNPEAETIEEVTEAIKHQHDEIVFNNNGDMVYNNRSYRRNFKSLWRSVEENRTSIRQFTKKKKSGSKSKHKLERQNRRKGRR